MVNKSFYFNKEAVELLYRASNLQPPTFMCFGRHFYYLRENDFIDNEYNVTYYGRRFVNYCLREGYIGN